MMKSKSVIRKAIVSVDYNGHIEGPEIQQRVNEWWEKLIMPGIEKLINDIGDDIVVSIKDMLLDIHIDAGGQWEQQAARQILESFRYEIASREPGQSSSPAVHLSAVAPDAWPSFKPVGTRLADEWVFFLQKGFIPWWSTAQNTREWKQSVEDYVLHTATTATMKQITRQLATTEIAARFAAMLSDSMFHQFLSLTAGWQEDLVNAATTAVRLIAAGRRVAAEQAGNKQSVTVSPAVLKTQLVQAVINDTPRTQVVQMISRSITPYVKAPVTAAAVFDTVDKLVQQLSNTASAKPADDTSVASSKDKPGLAPDQQDSVSVSGKGNTDNKLRRAITAEELFAMLKTLGNADVYELTNVHDIYEEAGGPAVAETGDGGKDSADEAVVNSIATEDWIADNAAPGNAVAEEQPDREAAADEINAGEATYPAGNDQGLADMDIIASGKAEAEDPLPLSVSGEADKQASNKTDKDLADESSIAALQQSAAESLPGVTAPLPEDKVKSDQPWHPDTAQASDAAVATQANPAPGNKQENKAAETGVTKPVLSKAEQERRALLKKEMHAAAEEGIYIQHAGLVLVAVYLSNFFKNVGVVQDQELVNLPKAVALLHYLATGADTFEEFEIVLPKILCGIEPDEFVDMSYILTDEDKQEADLLLEAVIANWDALKNTSPDGLRATFLMRDGRLTRENGSWKLYVQDAPFDILIGMLPWSISIIFLPWMPAMMHVNWHNG